MHPMHISISITKIEKHRLRIMLFIQFSNSYYFSLDVIPHDREVIYDECCSRAIASEIAMFIRQLLSVGARFSSVYIVLDALDECSDASLRRYY